MKEPNEFMDPEEVLAMVDRLDALELDAVREADEWLRTKPLAYGQRRLLMTCLARANERISRVFERRAQRSEEAKKAQAETAKNTNTTTASQETA